MLDTQSNTSISMTALYRRLDGIGLTRSTVRNTLLPDWWCDEFEEREGAVFEAAAYIARRTGLTFRRLVDETQELSLTQGSTIRFKKRQGTDENALAIASAIAEQAAKLAAYACQPDYQSVAGFGAQTIRAEILAKRQWVTLADLLDFCWRHGLPVVHLSKLPKGKGIKKFDGLAGIFAGRPALVTGKNHHSWAWMAFIVAHELGHIALGHVEEGRPLVDEKIDTSGNNDPQEQEADRFALELIYGKDEVNYMRRGFISPEDLAQFAREKAVKDNVNPASIVLNHAWRQDSQNDKTAWAIAQQAIKALEDGAESAIQLIKAYLEQGLDWDLLSDDNCEYLEKLVAP
ncbi:MAG: ImmA/IrrE family metallo-endopeptidase [Cyanobacteriota bacterium]|nr:ImmA/IrrE family metallo-endopeptidase [Cyanobacteriota bacterium]